MQNRSDREKPDTFVAKSREHHLRVTPQRVAIYRLLAGSKEHPSADVIFQNITKEFPHLSYDTVNRTLLTFSRIGLVSVVEGLGKPRRFDCNPNSHHHFHCRECGQIIDFYNADYDRLEVPKEIRDRFTVQEKKVVLSGICDRCQSR
jgi:Fur family peroxide stress response transcriptional regulator